MKDWGKITVDGFKEEINQVYYSFNHDISTSEKLERTIRFVTGKIIYYQTHLPKNITHVLAFDFRGQNVSNEFIEEIESIPKVLGNKYNLSININI